MPLIQKASVLPSLADCQLRACLVPSSDICATSPASRCRPGNRERCAAYQHALCDRVRASVNSRTLLPDQLISASGNQIARLLDQTVHVPQSAQSAGAAQNPQPTL